MMAKTTLVFGLFTLLGLCLASPIDDHWRVVGGQDAPDGAYPYQVSMRGTSNSHVCGGSILTTRTILTAAHCINTRTPATTFIVAGSNLVSSGGIRLETSTLVPHPYYNTITFENDIGLIILASDLVFSDRIRPISLGGNVGSGTDVTLTGWGRTSFPGDPADRLQMINLKTITVEECRSRFGTAGTVVESSLCTFTKTGEGACQGDSGGPLAYNGTVVGVVSWGSPCARGFPDVFAKVDFFKDWINANKV